MSNPAHAAKLKEGLPSWNAWRAGNPGIRIDLSGADLQGLVIAGDDRVGADLIGADLSRADLRHASMHGAELTGAKMQGCDLRRADLRDARLTGADLTGADLSHASMRDADLRDADLTRADLTGTNLFQGRLQSTKLIHAHLSGTVLINASLAGAMLGATTLLNLDLSATHGLSSITHLLPSDVGCATLWKSRGRIPEAFLRGAGVPASLIGRLPELMPPRDEPAFSFHFISHADADKEFAERLQARLRTEGVSTWLVSDSLKNGTTVEVARNRRVELSRLYDKLLIVLSEASLESEWLSEEIHRARLREFYEFRRILFPLRIATDEVLERWDEGLGNFLRSDYAIHDFSGWKYELSEPSVRKLLADLRVDARRKEFEGMGLP